jgi:excisionase family DNA binding protein
VPADDLYTVRELAAKWRVSKNFIYDEIARGNLQCVHLGRGRAKTRIPESIADAYWRKQIVAKPVRLRVVA